MAGKMEERIQEKVQEVMQEKVHELLENSAVYDKNRGAETVCFVQIVLILIVWKNFRNPINERMIKLAEWLGESIRLENEINWGQMAPIICFVIMGFILWILHFITLWLGTRMLEGKDINFGKLFFLYEYDTVYHRRFLKEKYKFYRKIFYYFFKTLLCIQGPLIFLVCIEKAEAGLSLDNLIVIYISFLIQQMLSEYTRGEYELKRSAIPKSIAQGCVKTYASFMNENVNTGAVSKPKILINGIPKVYESARFETQEEEFLYKNVQNLDHLELLEKLLRDESVLTDTPFYLDMGVALFLPIHSALMKGKKIIFFSGGSESVEEIKDWIESGLKLLTQLDDCWKIRSLAEQDQDWDIGLITMEDLTMLYEIRSLLVNPHGFVIVLLHPAKLLLEAQNELYEWGYLLSLEKIKPVYVIIERAMLGLLDLVSHVFRTEFKYVSKAAEPASATWVYALDGARRDIYLQEMKMTAMVGIGGMVATFAHNAGEPHVRWMLGDRLPVYDVNSIMSQHTMLAVKAGRKWTGVTDTVQAYAGVWGIQKEKFPFLVVEDDFNNILELVRQMQTRGTGAEVITVISQRYMLLPYMLDNIDELLNDIYGISAMSADFSEESLNRSVVLMKLLLYRGMTAQEIYQYRSRYTSSDDISNENLLTGKDQKQITEEIEQCIGGKKCIEITKKYNYDNQKNHRYYLQWNEELEEVCKELTAPAVYFDEEEKTKALLGGKHFWQIEQEYLPGQITTFHGKFYSIQGIGEVIVDGKEEKVLRVRRYREGVIYQPRYFQNRLYLLNAPINIREGFEKNIGVVRWKMVSASFSVKTMGYYTVYGVEKDDKVEKINLSGIGERVYCQTGNGRKNGIVIQIDNWAQAWPERKVFVIILNEIIRCLFPEGYPYIAILAVPEDINANGVNKQDKLEHLYYEIDMSNRNSIADFHFLILEDSRLDMGLIRMIDRHMERILQIAYSYCKWWKDCNSKEEYSFWGLQPWKDLMQTTQALVSALEEAGIYELTKYKKQEIYNSDLNRSNVAFCPACWKIVRTKGCLCAECAGGSLFREVYEELLKIARWQLMILFNLDADFPVTIRMREEKKGKKPIQRHNKSILYCSSEIQTHAALAQLVWNLIVIWQEQKIDIIRKDNAEKAKNYYKRAIADWYELCYMKKFGQKEYVENKHECLSKHTKKKEGKIYRELVKKNNYFEADNQEHPLKQYLDLV